MVFYTLQVGSTVTSHGWPLTELETGTPYPQPLLLLSYLPVVVFSQKALTVSFCCKLYGLMYNIPIIPCLQDLEIRTHQTWTQLEALSSYFDVLAGVDWLTAFQLTGLEKQRLPQGVYTGWVLGGADRGGASQCRSVVFPSTCRSGCWRRTDVRVQCHQLLISISTALSVFSFGHLSSPSQPRALQLRLCSDGFFRDRLVSNDLKLPWCCKPDFMYIITLPPHM